MKKDKVSQTAKGVAAVALALSKDRSRFALISEAYADQIAEMMRTSGAMSGLSVALFRNAFAAWLLRTWLNC